MLWAGKVVLPQAVLSPFLPSHVIPNKDVFLSRV